MAKYSGLKPGVKKFLSLILIVGLAAGAIFTIKKLVLDAPQDVGASHTVSNFSLADMAQTASLTNPSDMLPLPKLGSSSGKGVEIKYQVIPWNGQFPLMYANGGTRTAQGSLMEQAGLNITIIRQDDCFKTIADFIKNTQDLKENPNTVPMIMTFMGDGMPGFSVMLKELEELGPEYQPIVFYTMGRSNGEDAFMGPKEWKANPKNCLGKSVAGVERDGDINIVLKWAADNDIPVNVNTKVYDPNALNIIAATDFIDAANKYIAGYTEQRILVRNGKTVPDSIITINTDAVTTWTPGDVMVAEKKGGLVRLASTKEYSSQMPNVSVICKKWANEHRDQMVALITALGKAGDQVRSFPQAAEFAAKVSAEVYGDADKPAAYWLKYWKGIEEKDATGMKVQLGGSAAFNLADAANMLGLGPDGKDRYKVTYETFGKILEKLYPKEMEGWLPYSKVVDKSFLMAAYANRTETTEALKTEYASEITSEVSNKIYKIQFALNSAEIDPRSYDDLYEIAASATIAEGLKLGIYGHTDALGDDQKNQELSERRAAAIADYLQRKARLSPKQMEVRGYGETKPVFGDASDTRNRCVEIVLGT